MATPPSLRRELSEPPPLRDVDASLRHVSREDLEREVMALRRELNEKDLIAFQTSSEYRDVLSHTCTGKNEDYLMLNKSTDKSDKEKDEEAPPMSEIFRKAGMRALGGGLPGAAAMMIQVCTLMPMRSTMNYQYANGTTTTAAMKHLYSQGGIARFYKGIAPALFQGPLARFGDTAANAGVLSLLDSYHSTKDLPMAAKTFMASMAAAAWRVNLMPIDTMKTIMQVEGSKGMSVLGAKVKRNGIGVMYHGALGASTATFMGHFPWFFVNNLLQQHVPQADTLGLKLFRNASIGFCSSAVSDTFSNGVRVIKTYKQTSATAVTYPEAAKTIIAKDGIFGLLGRGLKTRLLANGMQGALFSVAWKFLEEKLNPKFS